MEVRSRVLLVEDDPDDATLLQRGIQDAADDEFEVIEVHSLQAAMDILEEHAMDLVLLDLGLPDAASEFAGLDLLVGAFPEVPVIVVTGEAEGEDLAPRAALHGAADSVFKNQASIADLLRVMRSVRNRIRFQRRRGRDDVKTDESPAVKGGPRGFE